MNIIEAQISPDVSQCTQELELFICEGQLWAMRHSRCSGAPNVMNTENGLKPATVFSRWFYAAVIS